MMMARRAGDGLEEDYREKARCMIYLYCVDRGFFPAFAFSVVSAFVVVLLYSLRFEWGSDEMRFGIFCLGKSAMLFFLFFVARPPYLTWCRMSFPLLQAGSSVGDRGRGLEFDNCSENFDGRKVSHEPLAAAMCGERTGGFEPVASPLSQPHTVISNIFPLPFPTPDTNV
jgi:hypothetical protein